ncbi:hypothetical protein AN639_06520 [Candidatus Epulonipiscium fishelsonii]|uniref:Uncharacterized protein n=1 Tax=Candidatus Epulonipiscium fishelsonii TaxID=77094 RepID=A0ACC8XCG8_9FIRM|nr:hypothetical protein AN639_06520 [Epulopiscium sp. SCG-B05WGA-EpuloA1]ONI40414.1 hypothetical protein AN396_06290 [Epulopiscium sp. SCG-B11WGA-EpuloA1]
MRKTFTMLGIATILFNMPLNIIANETIPTKTCKCKMSPEKREENLKQKLLAAGYTEEQVEQKIEERKIIIAGILKSYKLTEIEFKELKKYKKEGEEIFQAKLAEKNLTPEIMEKIHKEIKNETKKMFPELKEDL